MRWLKGGANLFLRGSEVVRDEMILLLISNREEGIFFWVVV